ncbi:MAG: 1-(5-phosphoribosyl)-5-[(5-phosphoribosylamino)methylideneamino] imidazole-4-carboxamide isomerase [Pseudomonadota bacterium]
MIIYPAIELMQGRCVSLRRGNLHEADFWDVDPVDIAKSFVEAGAEGIHVTDLDAVAGHEMNNLSLVAEITRKAGAPIQVSGGFRTQERIEYAFETGAARVVMGTIATRHPDWVKAMAKYYPDQIVLAVDVWNGQVMVDGWREACVIRPETLIAEFADVPLAAIKITDIDNDVDATEASLGVISKLAEASNAPVIASGLVHSINDIARLKYVPKIAGALVGRALVRGTVDLAEALEVAGEAKGRVAEFI